MKPDKSDSIIIVGAGVFGLSTAIHLAQRGYNKVTVFDRHDYDDSRYSYFAGADAASADLNKIVRSAYGGVSIYQNLTLEAIEGWKAWNEELSRGGPDLPPGMSSQDRVFIPNSNLVMTDAAELPAFDQATIDSMEAAGHHDTQLLTTDPKHRQLAKSKGYEFALDPFRRESRGQRNVAVIDTTGGTAVADKACRYALQKARRLGVKFVMASKAGAFHRLLISTSSPPSGRKVQGIVTSDGQEHHASFVIVACGGWTPSLVPTLDGLCETTAGSVALIKIPKTSGLWDRLAPENFPTWTWKVRDGAEGGLYGFARDDNGWFKIGYRGTKYTNPITQKDGIERSVPVTRWSSPSPDQAKLTSIPEQAARVIQRFLDEHLPELAEEGIGISNTRICWYNDSFDNHLLIDRVAEHEGLMVATAGSGHAFKYLPIIGNYVVDVLERQGLDRECLRSWRWRRAGEGVAPYNVLMEGAQGSRALANISLRSEEELHETSPRAKL